MKYFLKHEDIVVMELSLDSEGFVTKILSIIDEDRIPPYIKNRGEAGIAERHVNDWIEADKISDSRDNIDKILLRNNVKTTRELFIKNMGLKLTDHYWICPEAYAKSWKDANYFENRFDEKTGDVLLGDINELPAGMRTPESSSGGMMLKKWEQREDGIYMVKKGNGSYYQEPYNEVIAGKIMELIGLPYCKYTIEIKNNIPRSVCKNFLGKDKELIHAGCIDSREYKKGDMYHTFLAMCKKNTITNFEDNLHKMLLVDYIIGNVDRHYSNFGFIRDCATLQYEGLAPVYDSGNSLWYNVHENEIRTVENIKSRPFNANHHEQIKKVNNSYINMGILKNVPDIVNDVLKENTYINTVRREKIVKGVQWRLVNLDYKLKKDLDGEKKGISR